MNPHLSAEAYAKWDFDFNRNPLAPPGTQVLIFEDPTKRRTFVHHGMEEWYLGPSPEHYECYTIYALATRAERIVNKVECFLYTRPVTQICPLMRRANK